MESGQSDSRRRLHPFQFDRGAHIAGPQARCSVRLLRHRVRMQGVPDAAGDPHQPGEAGPQHEGEGERNERATAFPSGDRKQGKDEDQRSTQRDG